MSGRRSLEQWMAGLAVVATCACGGGGEREGSASGATTASTPAAAENRADDVITVAGCLQKGSGDSFILTRINQPSQSVGTTGGSATTGGGSAGTVEREQLRSAAGAYRVDPEGDVKLEGLVGKEIRVEGRIKENMDLPRANADAQPAKVREGDLYEISATSVTTLAEACSSPESPAPAAGATTAKPSR